MSVLKIVCACGTTQEYENYPREISEWMFANLPPLSILTLTMINPDTVIRWFYNRPNHFNLKVSIWM